MHMLACIGLSVLLTLPAQASFGGNLNYNSPSRRHLNLGINVPAVSRRSLKRDATAFQPADLNFTHGVASGDPYADSVILWTRVAPSLKSSDSNVVVEGPVPLYSHDTESYIKADANPICVQWSIAQAEGNVSTKAVASGTAYTTGDIDYTVKVKIFCDNVMTMTLEPTDSLQVEATGLQAFTDYSYQFTVCDSNNTSPVGLTKTAPPEDADVDEVNFAVFSCSNYRKYPSVITASPAGCAEQNDQPMATSTHTVMPLGKLSTTTW